MNKVFLSLGVTGILFYSIPAMPVRAIEINKSVVDEQNELERAAGLLRRYSLSVSSSEKTLYINGATAASDTMQKIGYKNIVIQYSSDGVNWYKEKNIDDLLKTESNSYNLNSYSVSVKGGYYYRVTCTHYAKESGLFGSSQSVDNTSNSVWVS